MRVHVFSIVSAATLGALALSYISYYIIRRKRLQKPPKNAKWKLIGVVEEIAMFPLTSAASILLNEAHCKIDGLYSNGLKDRSLILYDEKDNSAFAGTYPHMLSITTEVQDQSTLILRAPLIEPLTINLEVIKLKNYTVKQKQGYKLYLVEGELEHNNWFSKVILNKSEGLKLFFCVKTEFDYDIMGEDKSDFNPIMVMNEFSVNDLNQRLSVENQAHHLQFRGNVLIKPTEIVKPYDEDNWRWLRFGNEKETDEKKCILRYKNPCLRCILPNISIDTFKRNSKFEPLKTLKKYRMIHDSKDPTLGAYYKVFQEGVIKLNDPVYALVS